MFITLYNVLFVLLITFPNIPHKLDKISHYPISRGEMVKALDCEIVVREFEY